MLLTPPLHSVDGFSLCPKTAEKYRNSPFAQQNHLLGVQTDKGCLPPEVTNGQSDFLQIFQRSDDEVSSGYINIGSSAPWANRWLPACSLKEKAHVLENECAPLEWRASREPEYIAGANEAILREATGLGVAGYCGADAQLFSDYIPVPKAEVATDILVEEKPFINNVHNFYILLTNSIEEKDLAAGRDTHSHIIRHGYELDDFLVSHLIRTYASFGSLVEAARAFCKLSKASVFSWNAIISAHVKLGQNEQGLTLFYSMLESSIEPNGHILVEVLKAVSNMEELPEGTKIHACIIEHGLESDLYVRNMLVHMYATCRALEDACRVFNRLPVWDIVSWNALISAHAQQGYSEEALCLFKQVSLNGLIPNCVTFLSVLKVDFSLVGLEAGTQLHACIMEHGLENGKFLGNCLIDLYIKCDCLEDGRIVFERLTKRDLVTYNTLISGYAQSSQGHEAAHLFESMVQEGIDPDGFTFVSILQAYLGTQSIKQLMLAYSYIVEGRFESDVYVESALINTLAKFGRLHDAHRVFDRSEKQSILIWNVLIDGYSQRGHSKDAFSLFEQMKCQHRLNPDAIIYSSILKAFSGDETSPHGQLIHASVLGDGFETDQFIASSLISMYARCGSMEDAQCVFERLDHPNIVVWSALTTGFIQLGQSHKALQLFEHMQQEGLEPDEITLVCILDACSNVAAIGKGRHAHALMIQIGLELDAFTCSSLIDMYADCGSFEDSCVVFELLPVQTIVTYNTIIAASAQHNNFLLAEQYFKRMVQAGEMPQSVTFLCLLSACNRAGQVDKSCFFLRSMSMEFGIMPAVEHLNLMVDILGSQRLWNEAEDLLEVLPFQCNVVGWTSLLTSCRMHASVDLGRRCFNYVVAMDPAKAAGYALMSNIYARAGLPGKAEKIDELRRYVNGWKKPGKAFIEINDHVHVFSVGEKNHPQSNKINAVLERLMVQIKLEGYNPSVDLVLGPSSNQDKEAALCGHCEKVAIAFGLVSTPHSTTIRIAKNLRMCVDCHSATKIISKIERREIVITDTYCVHKFEGGTCSCSLVD